MGALAAAVALTLTGCAGILRTAETWDYYRTVEVRAEDPDDAISEDYVTVRLAPPPFAHGAGGYFVGLLLDALVIGAIGHFGNQQSAALVGGATLFLDAAHLVTAGNRRPLHMLVPDERGSTYSAEVRPDPRGGYLAQFPRAFGQRISRERAEIELQLLDGARQPEELARRKLIFDLTSRYFRPILSAQAVLQSTSSPGVLEAGDAAEVQIHVSNTGRSAAKDVVIAMSADGLPREVFVPQSLAVGEVPPGETVTVRARVAAQPGLGDGSFVLKSLLQSERGTVPVADLLIPTRSLLAPRLKVYCETGALHAGVEQIVRLNIANQGKGPSRKVRLKVSSSRPEALFLNADNLEAAPMAPGTSRTVPVSMVVRRGTAELSTLDLKVDVIEERALFSTTANLDIPVVAAADGKTPPPTLGHNDLIPRIRALPEPAEHADRWMLAIGIDQYAEFEPVPHGADAAEMMALLARRKFGVPQANVFLLKGRDATGGRIRSRLAQLQASVKPGDTLYFYYCGHGMPDRKGESAYLVPADAGLGIIEDAQFRLSRIHEELAATPAGHIVEILDACFSGRGVQPGVAPILVRAQDTLPDPARMTVLMAAEGEQYANDLPARASRLFTYHLVKGVLEDIGSADALITEVRNGVGAESRLLGPTYLQNPLLAGNGSVNLP